MSELVLAHWREDLSWGPPGIQATVYTKGVDLPNVGREAGTYLHHMIVRRNSLDDWTIFSQGNPFPHVPNFLSVLGEDRAGIEFYGSAMQEVEEEGWGHRWRDANREIWAELYSSQSPLDMRFVPGAIFGIDRKTLLSRSTDFYRAAFNLCVSRPKGPWEFERFWPLLWGPGRVRY